jgi:hypothetical protein
MGHVIIQRDGAALIEDEDDGERSWVDQLNKEVPREAWPDEWGPTANGPTDDHLVNYLVHEQAFNMAVDGDPIAAEQQLCGFGYRDAGHFFRVRATILKHFGDFSGPSLEDGYFGGNQHYISATMKAGQLGHQATMQQTLQGDPDIMAPVEDVTMEQYASLQAQVIHLGPDQVAGFLAQHGIDMAKWSRVSNEWNERMGRDTTHTLTTIYGQAFQSAGAGQFGAQAQAHAATGYDGSAAGGGEPMPFEKCCEIQGAMQAWSKTGQDVNAMLSQTFAMNAADFSAAHSWWLTQLMADVSRFNHYSQLVDHYEQHYSGGAGPAPDSDLSF